MRVVVWTIYTEAAIILIDSEGEVCKAHMVAASSACWVD